MAVILRHFRVVRPDCSHSGWNIIGRPGSLFYRRRNDRYSIALLLNGLTHVPSRLLYLFHGLTNDAVGADRLLRSRLNGGYFACNIIRRPGRLAGKRFYLLRHHREPQPGITDRTDVVRGKDVSVS